MTIKTKFSDTDPKLKMLIKRRNLSKGAIKNYDAVFREVYELFGDTPSDIIQKAKREQKPFKDINTGEYDVLDLEDRIVTRYQFEYWEYLEKNNLSNRTIKLKLNTFRALLGEYNIEKPQPIKIVIKRDRIRDEDIVSWRDVEKAMSFCKGIRDKAIISFIATTGLRRSDVTALTIGDLVDACAIYFDEDEEKNIHNLLNKSPEYIVPCWEIMPKKTDKKSQLCVTFNTAECSEYLWQYLHERIVKDVKNGGDGSLDLNEPLFATSTKKQLYSTAIEQLFQRLNKRLGGDKDKNGTYGKFRSHSLRKLFSTTCRRNITRVMVNSDKTSEIDIISIFTGHVPPNESNSRVYEAIESDSFDSYLRKTYLALSPYLSIKDIEIKDVKTKQYEDLEEKNMELKKQLEVQAVSMQREMDEQKEYYEKKIRHLESVNLALDTKVSTVEKQVLKISNQNNISKIQEVIADNDLVNKYGLASKIVELYISDIQEDDSIIVVNSYIDTLISRAYNSLPDKIRNSRNPNEKNEEYNNLKKRIMLIKDTLRISLNIGFSEEQRTLINNVLIAYCDELWENNEFEPDVNYIKKIVRKIADDGKL